MVPKRVWTAALTLVLILGLLAGCAPAPTPQVIEKVVKETVVVEKPVPQTVVVEKQVTKEVVKEVTKEVIKEVPKDKTIVTLAYNNYFNVTFGPAAPPFEELKKAVAAKYPDITLQLNVMPYEAGPWHDNYVTWFMAKDGTTDLLGVGAYWTAEFGEADWLLPLNDKVDKKILDKLNPAYLAAHTYKGKLLGLGPWWGGIGGLYYRKDLLEKYNLQPPKTYDDVVKIAQTIMKDNKDLTGWTWPALNDWVLVNRWIEFLNGFGGKYFDDAGKCAMASPEATAALKYMVNLIDSGISPKEITTWKEEDSMVRFVSGKAIFHTGRQDMMFWLDDPKKSQIGGKWGFIPNPAQPNGKPAGFYEGWAFSINKYSKHPDAALKVLEVMFDFPMQKAFNLSQGPLQANMDIYKDPDVIKNNPNMPLIEAVASTAVPPIPSPAYAELAGILAEELHSALTKLKTPEAALKNACTRIDNIKKK
jgi:multiple sugar transport system substrate-binding protein